MATYQTGAAERGRGFKPFPEGTLGVRKQSYSPDASHSNFGLNDVIEMIPVYEGETVYDLFLIASDLDTGVALEMSVGDGDDADLYLAADNVGQAGGVVRIAPTDVAAWPKVYSADDTIDITVTTAAGTAAAGTVTLVALVV